MNSPTVQFAVPWFINYPDPSYNGNLRNQGINAPPITRSAPFTPDYSSPFDVGYTYKGVFLNQNTHFDLVFQFTPLVRRQRNQSQQTGKVILPIFTIGQERMQHFKMQMLNKQAWCLQTQAPL